MPQITVGTIVKILVASLVVGFLLSILDISPQDLIKDVFGNAKALLEWSLTKFGKALSYVLLGAVIVVPIWAIIFLVDWMKKKKG